jgi:pimeloyl-ACP methyl ester carboxylesterase
MSIEDFQITTPESDLMDLRERLSRTRWPEEISNSEWSQGTNLSYLKELATYWEKHFDWRLQESRLNQFNHFRADVGGLKLHFIHEKGKGPRPLPLALIHGWPSSFAEMLKVIPQLTDPVSHGGEPSDSFDVIVPSLPGYGYSDVPRESGMSIWRAADLIHRLMQDVLGYPRFVASGGDWGAYAASYLGYHYAEQIPAIHLSFVPGGINPEISSKDVPLSRAELDLLAHRQKWTQYEGGYEHLQSTKPQTLAYALNDSPVGLAGWILEKMYSWSDCKGSIENVFTKDEILTTISIYWFTRTIGSSIRLYYETQENPWTLSHGRRIETPTGISVLPKELSVPPREWVERIYNVQQWTEWPHGGHFAAAEQPDRLVRDIRSFFRQFREQVRPGMS